MKQDDRRFHRNLDSIAHSLEIIAQELRWLREAVDHALLHAEVRAEEEPDGPADPDGPST